MKENDKKELINKINKNKKNNFEEKLKNKISYFFLIIKFLIKVNFWLLLLIKGIFY